MPSSCHMPMTFWLPNSALSFCQKHPNLYVRDAKSLETYAIPYAVRVWGGSFYNRQVFAKSGFDPDVPPRYWEELCQAAERMTIWSDHEPVQIGFDALAWNAMTMQFFQLEGGEWIVSDDYRKVLIDSTVAVDAVQVLTRLYKITYPGPGGRNDRTRWSNWSLPERDFAQGKIAMLNLVGTPSFLVRHNIKKFNPDLREADLGFFITRPSEQVMPRIRSTVTGIGIPRSSKSPTLAWQFAKWFLSADINDAVTSALSLHPARIDVYQRQWLRQDRKMRNWFESLELVDPARVSPVKLSFDQKLLDSALSRIFTGGVDITSALSEVAHVWQAQLNEAWEAL